MEMKALRIAYGEALVELGSKNKNVVVLDADLAHATTTNLFGDKFPTRFFNMGIAEANMMSAAAGLATSGYIPFASTFALFAAGRAFEQVRNSICYPKFNVKIAVSHPGLTVGEDGGSHQSIEDISLMRSLPNMTVVVPCDANEARQAVFAAADFVGPMYLRFARPPSPIFLPADYKFEMGKAKVLRKGSDLAIFATGLMVYKALEAADILAKDGIKAAVVNFSTIKPIDKKVILEMAAETGKIITVEEHSTIGGLGSAVAEVLGEELNGSFKLKRIGVEDKFGQSGTPDQLLKAYGLDAENICHVAQNIMRKTEVTI
jgi:transketolase